MIKKYIDENGLLYFWTKLKTLIGGKVDKIDGKGLSTNDYTTTEKNKLDGLTNYTHPTTSGNKHIPAGGSSGQILRWSADGTAAWGNDNNTTYSVATTSANGLMSKEDKTKLNGIATNAQVNVIESIKVNGTAQTPSNKAVNITVPTNNNQLTNGAGYQTSAQVQNAINNALTSAVVYKGTVTDYSKLPTTNNKKGDMWDVSSTGKNYVWNGSEWDDQGGLVDLSECQKASELVSISNAEIDTIMES